MRSHLHKKRSSSNRAFSIAQLLTVLFILSVLIVLILGYIERQRLTRSGSKCASNLRQIGEAIQLYNADQKEYPRGLSVLDMPLGNGFSPNGAPNDPTIPFFLLLKTVDLSPELFICNSTNHTAMSSSLIATSSNLIDPSNLSYSIANPYPSLSAMGKGYKFSANAPVDFAIVSDRNDADPKDIAAAFITASPNILRRANSHNHEKEGMNVLFNDGHVDWFTNAWCGANRENIFAPASAHSTPENPTLDMTLWPDPQSATDSVMVPAKGHGF